MLAALLCAALAAQAPVDPDEAPIADAPIDAPIADAPIDAPAVDAPTVGAVPVDVDVATVQARRDVPAPDPRVGAAVGFGAASLGAFAATTTAVWVLRAPTRPLPAGWIDGSFPGGLCFGCAVALPAGAIGALAGALLVDGVAPPDALFGSAAAWGAGLAAAFVALPPTLAVVWASMFTYAAANGFVSTPPFASEAFMAAMFVAAAGPLLAAVVAGVAVSTAGGALPSLAPTEEDAGPVPSAAPRVDTGG